LISNAVRFSNENLSKTIVNLTGRAKFHSGWEAGLISSVAMTAIWFAGARFSPDADSAMTMFLCSLLVTISGLVGTFAGVYEYCQSSGVNMFPKVCRVPLTLIAAKSCRILIFDFSPFYSSCVRPLPVSRRPRARLQPSRVVNESRFDIWRNL
jgi:hypothetical protein